MDDACRSTSPELSPLHVGTDVHLMPLPEYKAAGTTVVDFDGLLHGDEALQFRQDLTAGCGGRLWPAGMTLARHMLRYHRNDLRGARILELGAGCGLVGLAVARGCHGIASPVLVTDQAEMAELMAHNISLNRLESSPSISNNKVQVESCVLPWGVRPLPPRIASCLGGPPDVILAADCVYVEPAFPLLLQTLRDLLEMGGPACRVYFCFKKRRRADMRFMKSLRKAFFVEEPEDAGREGEGGFARQGLFLYVFSTRT